MAALVHEDVLGLYVPVDDALLVRRGKGVRDLQGERDGAGGRQRPVGADLVGQGPSQDELHRHVRDAPVFAGVEDLGYVGMREGGHVPRLGTEPAGLAGTAGGFRAQDLERHLAREHRVPGGVDEPRAALADEASDPVPAG